MGRRSLLLGLGLSPVAGWCSAGTAPLRLRYPRPDGPPDAHDYMAGLLRLALQAAGLQAAVEASRAPMVQGRWLLELGRAELDVAWAMTSETLERRLLPVRVPVFRGLFGWRVLLVRRADRERWAEARSLADLKDTVFAQGADWTDTAILRANGLRVHTGTHKSRLEQAVLQGRADAYPRGLPELAHELERPGQALVLEPHLLLHYRAPVYFFVHPGRPELAEALSLGLRRLQVDGRLERYVREGLFEDLEQAALTKRRVIELRNPELPAQTPLEPGWWWQPQ